MHEAAYYRGQAARARRLAGAVIDREVRQVLLRMAQDYDELAEDLDENLIEIRHPELLAQNRD